MHRCAMCDTHENIEQQLAGFDFCFYCLPKAQEKGASYWWRLAHLLAPWWYVAPARQSKEQS